MQYSEIQGFYGSQNTPCTILVAECSNAWRYYYCVKGSKMVNITNEPIIEGANVEEIADFDCFTWSSEINTLDELENAINN